MRTGKQIIPALLLIACILLPATYAFASARVLTSAEMREVFHDLACRNSPWPKSEIQVNSFTAQPASLDLPAGKIEFQRTGRPYPNFLGRKAITMNVLVDGKEAGTVKMIGDLHLFGEVACANRHLDRREQLTANDIKMVRRDITALGDDLVREQTSAIGKQINTSLQPGDIIRASQLAEPPLITRGELVTIIAQTAGLRATAPGEAKRTGAKGDIIKVKNLISRKYIFAKVIDDGIVQVEF